MSRRPLSAQAWAAAACAGTLAACASIPTRFYTLDPVAPAAAGSFGRVLPVRVDAVHLPPGLNRPEIVEQTAANRVTVHDFALWSAPLGEQARRVLTQDLAARLPAGAVTFPDAPKPPTGRGLVVDVLAISHADGQAVMDASWTLTVGGRTSAGAPLAYTGRTLRLTAPASGGGAEAVAPETSALMGRLADAIAADLTAGR